MSSIRSITSSDYDIEQKMVLSSTSPSLSTTTILSSIPKFIDYNPQEKNETSSVNVYIPPVLTSLIIDYLAGDMGTEESEPATASLAGDKNRLTLFGRNCYELMAQRAATLILWGEEKDADEAVLILKNNPAFLDYKVEVTDPRGRSIKQKVFEIAFMAGDIDVKQGITNQKEKGLVERITIACDISQARIDEAKQVLLSEEAKNENEKRNQRIMKIVEKFGEGIINIRPNEEEKNEKIPYEDRISAYRLRCKIVIDQYKADLKSAQSESIHCGYIFDPSILMMADAWFKENVPRLVGWWSLQSDVFDVNGYGALQGELSSRDAQVVKSGLGNLTHNKKVPERSLKNTDGASYFYDSRSALGDDFLIGYYGLNSVGGGGLFCGRSGKVEKLMSSKNISVAKLTRHQTQQLLSWCTIM